VMSEDAFIADELFASAPPLLLPAPPTTTAQINLSGASISRRMDHVLQFNTNSTYYDNISE
jgi:hypothetical protein